MGLLSGIIQLTFFIAFYQVNFDGNQFSTFSFILCGLENEFRLPKGKCGRTFKAQFDEFAWLPFSTKTSEFLKGFSLEL